MKVILVHKQICNIEESVESAVGILTRCLPFIVPNVLINKREVS